MLNQWIPFVVAISLLIGSPAPLAQAQQSQQRDTSHGDRLIEEYFRGQTEALTAACLSEIETLQDWESRRAVYRQQLLEMLGLDPLPESTPLKPVVTGTVKHEDILVENLHFQSLPGLYVTGNLYRPVHQDKPLPAILYVCGHGGVKKNGVSLGNKTHYQHHGAWFARHGYVCLTIDTIQLGELEGIHHGTYREGMWWWNNRGYTPAGVEAWNCVRSLDYLQSRSEVDGQRLGVTGRSGGGAYSWWVAAIDERIKVAVPVAGITSLKNHVVDGCVEGHCDCMYMVNTYRWDYPMVAALVAPRPLLISNTDKDSIFPLDGVIDVHAKARRIYELYGAPQHLGLQITEGPHKDTQELRVHAFRWFNRFLKSSDELLQSPAVPLFEQEQLKVFNELPSDQRVTSIHETFVPVAPDTSLPSSRESLMDAGNEWLQLLREKTFRGWDTDPHAAGFESNRSLNAQGIQLLKVEFIAQPPYQLPIYRLSSEEASHGPASIRVLTQNDWETISSALTIPFPTEFTHPSPAPSALADLQTQLASGPIILVLPRGVGPTEWTHDERERTHIRRRFMQLGQTLAGMQIYDVACALKVIQADPSLRSDRMRLSAQGDAATWALHASLFSSGMTELKFTDLPPHNRTAPDLLNVSRFVELPQLALLAALKNGRLLLDHSNLEDRAAWGSILQNNALASELISLSGE